MLTNISPISDRGWQSSLPATSASTAHVELRLGVVAVVIPMSAECKQGVEALLNSAIRHRQVFIHRQAESVHLCENEHGLGALSNSIAKQE